MNPADSLQNEPESPLRVLTFTSLFPNVEQPMHGLFVRERVRRLATRCALEVMAPVPWVPPIPGIGGRYGSYARVPATERDSGVPVTHPRFVVVPKVGKSLDGTLMAAGCAVPLRQLRRRFAFEVIDAHWAYPDGAAAAMLGRMLGCPCSITVRGDDVNIFAREPGRGHVIRWALRSADVIIALSHALKDAVLELTKGRANVVVVPNGVDGTRFHRRSQAEARARLGIAASDRLIVAAGRLHQSKGYAVLVEAAGRCLPREPQLRLAILGAPDSEADARPGIQEAAARTGMVDWLIMPGARPPDELAWWYAAADFFALPTIREGSPNVILEALATGLPCVTTRVGGIPDVLVEGEQGLLVEPTVEGFVAGLTAAFARSWDRDRVASLGGGRTWDRVADECLQHLRAVVRRPSTVSAGAVA